MAKFNAKDFFLQKGEKVVLGLALAGFGGLTVLGISSMLGAESPAKKTAEFKSEKDRLDRERNRDQGDPGITKVQPPDLAMRPIDASHFRSPFAPFETVDTPSSKRDNPVVLGIVDAQVDLVRAPIRCFDVIQYEDGKIEIGVLKLSKAGTFDAKGVLDIMNKNKGQRPGGNAPPPPAPVPIQQVPPPAAPMGGGRGERGGGPVASSDVAAGGRSERTVRYVPLNDFEKELGANGAQPAFAVYPLRMVVVQAAFPLKEQLEVIRRALRLKSIEDASKETATAPSAGPTFDGFEVERRIVAPNGQDYGWAPYDHVGQYVNKIGIRKVADQPDDGFLTYFLRYDQKMVMPLPALAADLSVYPALRLDSIVRGVNKIKEAGKPKITPSDMQKKFEGKDNPFAPTAGVGGLGGASGAFAGGGGIAAPAIGGEGRTGSGETGKGPRLPGAMLPPPESTINVPANMPELEHTLIRFLDVDIRPGFTYQYRLRVKMKNPNFKSTNVNRPDDAKTEGLMGPWVTIANEVGVPADKNLYAGDPVGYTDRVKKEFKDPAVVRLMDNKNGEIPVVQFQNWTEKIAIEPGKTEPAGYWVVNEIPVNRGEYVGRRSIVPLPMWSSEKVAFILQELPKYKVWQAKDQPKGLMVDFTTQTMMIDFEGGRQKFRTQERSLEDDADVEMMLLQPDGKVIVRSSGADRVDPDRSAREKAWFAWLEKIKAETEKAGLLSAPIPGAPMP